MQLRTSSCVQASGSENTIVGLGENVTQDLTNLVKEGIQVQNPAQGQCRSTYNIYARAALSAT